MPRKCALIDTDILIKIGSYHKEPLLRKILLSLETDLYIHEYILDEEMISLDFARNQLDEMLAENEIKRIEISSLGTNEQLEYESALDVLSSEMAVDLSKKRDHNAGEVKSMALAFAKGYQYFISDDREARVAAKKHLQKLDGTYLETISMKEIILHMKEKSKELGISRKTAKTLYTYSSNPKLARNPSDRAKLEMIYERHKKIFDNELWPLVQ